MPQLDPNTFIYQYVGIIVLLIVVYTTLSYIVLPTLLRLMLVRNLFLSTRQTLSELVNTVLPSYQQVISLKAPIRSSRLSNSVLANLSIITTQWLNLVASTLFDVINVSVNKDTAVTYGASVSILNEATIDYFILFLLIELEENNNE
jgi:hypothetical protein